VYVGPTAAGEGRRYFGKNSDRHPAEPQALCIIPRRKPSAATKVGEREFAVPDRGYAFALSRPSWMSGGEAGLNEHGVAIGNEAVFSKDAVAKDGVLGMDLLRGALCSAQSAKEALDFLTEWTETHDQGGNGAFRGKLFYSNSYIVADREEAFILETAGKRWAWKPIDGIAAISNAYSIEEDYKRLDARTRKEIAPVNERAACSDEADPGRKGRKESWREKVESRLYLRFTKGDIRRAAISAILEAAKPNTGLETVKSALRSHGERDPAHRGGMNSPCVHDGVFPFDQATTASFIVEYEPLPARSAILWFTGSSYPCVSVYKPVLLRDGDFLPLWTDYDYSEGAESAYAYWINARAWFKSEGAGRYSHKTDFISRRDGIETRIRTAATQAAAAPNDASIIAEARVEVNAAMRDWSATLPRRK